MSATPATRRLPRQRVAPVPAWWRDAVGVACAVTGAIVVALWLRGHGLQDLLRGAPADRLMSLGRVTGLVAADLLLVQVFLMARVPVIERSYGQDELARRHRLVGFWSFNLLMAHIVLITVGYALADRTDVVHETWTLVTSYAGMLLAVAGTVALVVVTVTSIRVARNRLRYESWHLLHLYAYVGVGASVPHEVWTGADFTRGALTRAYWWGSYLLAAGAVVVYRLALPAWRTARHGVTVTSVVRESPDVVTVHMGGTGLRGLPVVAGQFFIWRFLDGPGWSRGHPYSLSAAPRHDRVQITAKELGDGSARLAGLRPGTRVLIEGPYGRLTGVDRTRAKVVMFAGGIGITPMRALLEDLPYARGHATLVYREHSERDVIFREELEALAAERGVTLHLLVGPRNRQRDSWLPASAARWDDAKGLRKLVPDLLERDVFLCGPAGWTAAVERAVLAAGLPQAQLHQERFAW